MEETLVERGDISSMVYPEDIGSTSSNAATWTIFSFSTYEKFSFSVLLLFLRVSSTDSTALGASTPPPLSQTTRIHQQGTSKLFMLWLA
jgi:hypothetical protein